MSDRYYVVRIDPPMADIIVPMTNLSRAEYTYSIGEAMYTLNHMQTTFPECTYKITKSPTKDENGTN